MTHQPRRQPMSTRIEEAIEAATARIAPTWPLDRFIAVDPLWGFIADDAHHTTHRLRALHGIRWTMPNAWYLDHYRAGTFRDDHLQAALAATGSAWTVANVLDALAAPDEPPTRRATVVDLSALPPSDPRGRPWSDIVVDSISTFCAGYFDHDQSLFRMDTQGGLFASWRRMAVSQAPFRGVTLADSATATIAQALGMLNLDPEHWEDYLIALLLDVNGWAAWCAFQAWEARLQGRADHHLVELLAIRIAYEIALCQAHPPAPLQDAMRAWLSVREPPPVDPRSLCQHAMEAALQQHLLSGLMQPTTSPTPTTHAVFCIDVRSEVFRRALEAQCDTLQTRGFAGFFGLPIGYVPVGGSVPQPLLPGLLAPSWTAHDTGVSPDLDAARRSRMNARSVWKQLKHTALSGFTFVEASGWMYAPKLLSDAWGWSRPAPSADQAGLTATDAASRKPRLALDQHSPDARCDLAANMLRGMGFTQTAGRLVALIGHGSQTVNNPHAAGLDCGACCGRTGAVNARVAAALLNEEQVRSGLSARGVNLSAQTIFVAGMHDTTTDEVTLFDLDELPASHRPDVDALITHLARAGDTARAERAPSLGLQGDAAILRRATRARAGDWAAVRPEWGLADNATFVIAPREHTRHLSFGGRSFLHHYRWQEDTGFKVLEGLLTAPMVVAHWINAQYHASTTDPERYGSGNKVLHNVVGGHIGVFEGNGGDLRIGLPLQCVHDGQRWRHTPLRLSVFVAAPIEAIDAVIDAHATVRHLVDHGWLHLVQFDVTRGASIRVAGDWQPLEPGI